MKHIRSRRALRAAAGLALVLAACSEASGESASSSSTTTTAAPTTTVRATTTTSSTTTTTTTSSTTTTTTTAVPAPSFPLLGTPLPDPAWPIGPALVVKIDNAPAARPQTGFNAADIVFEEIVNDNLTRFAMVFQSRGSNPVGPIRSGRIQDVDLFGMLNVPLFAWSGGNATVTRAIDDSDLINLGPNHADGYFRLRGRGSPHNLYNTTDALFAQAPPEAGPAHAAFEYRAAGDAVPGVPSEGVDVALDSIDATWRWDPATSRYYRTMEGAPHRDAGDGEQVSTDNVVVLVMDYVPGISGSPDAQSIGWGEAFVLTGGQAVHGIWSRPDRLSPYTLTAEDGSAIKLTPGQSFVELPRAGHTLVL